MEIRQIVRGSDIGFASALTAQKAKSRSTGGSRSTSDRIELTRQWAEQMREQSAQIQTLLSQGAGQDKEKKSEGILDMLDGASAESEELDALSRQLDVQMKCMKIAANIMKGKRVPPEDERYLMENDPDGYKLAIAMRSLVKEDDEECESVLKDEDKEGEETSETGEASSETAPSGGDGAFVE